MQLLKNCSVMRLSDESRNLMTSSAQRVVVADTGIASGGIILPFPLDLTSYF